MVIGLISMMVPLMLNPAIAAAAASAGLFFMLFAEMIGFLIPKKKNVKLKTALYQNKNNRHILYRKGDRLWLAGGSVNFLNVDGDVDAGGSINMKR